MVRRPSLRWVVSGFASVVLILAVLEGLWVNGALRVPGFDPRGEQNVPVAVATATLLGAAVLAWSVASTASFIRVRAWPLIGLGAVLVYMAADEFLELHEGVEEAAEGTSWMWFYLPIVAMAAGCWILAVFDLGDFPLARVMLGVGALAWLALEYWQWGGNSSVLEHPWMMVPEEALELLGSGLFAGGALVVLRDPRARQGLESMTAIRHQ